MATFRPKHICTELANIFVPFVEHLAGIQMVTIPFQVHMYIINLGGNFCAKIINIRFISPHLMSEK